MYIHVKKKQCTKWHEHDIVGYPRPYTVQQLLIFSCVSVSVLKILRLWRYSTIVLCNSSSVLGPIGTFRSRHSE